jgi:hypothetical protein
MKNSFGIPYLGPWVLGLAFVCSVQARADSLLDFTMFNPPTAEQRKIADPVMTWLVQADPKAYCEKASPKDGMFVRPEGCVYWHVRSSSCTIVTTNSTTHSQLGHLFVHCLQGQ